MIKLAHLFKSALLGLSALVGTITLHNAHAAPITWNGWVFDYEIGVNKAGLALKNVSYQGHLLIKKASLPVIKGIVLNDAGSNVCPPYQDKLDNNLNPMPWANNATLSQRQFSKDGRLWYEIGIYKKINSKEYFQAYYLSADGLFDAHLYSRGKECVGINQQYPYWRIDTDVDGAANDVVETFDNSGAGFKPLQTESRLELGLVNREHDLMTNTAVYSFNSNYNFSHPDGTTTFGSYDYGSTKLWYEMLYKASEDVEWPNDLTVEIATSPFANDESILGKDIVGWYFGVIANVNNVMAAVNPNPWRATGITLIASWVNTVQPDVVVDRVSYFDGNFFAVVKNQGDFMVPPNKVIGVGYSVDGVYRTWAAVPGGIAPGSISSIYTSNFPDRRYPIPDGDHVITAWVDDVNRFAESDETNNKLSQAISLTGPDYTAPYVKLISPTNNSTVTGSVVTVSAKAEDNIRVTEVKFKLLDPYLGFVYPVGTDSTAPYVISWDSTQAFSGTYTLVATAYDAAGHQKEDSIRVIVKPPLSLQRPDIVVTDLAYANGQFSCTIKNQGGESIPADAWLGFGYFVDGKQKTWTYTTGPLASGESKILGVAGGGAFTIPTGTHTIKIIADDQSSVAEQDETNNSLSKTITVP